jgi:hypothetical protein
MANKTDYIAALRQTIWNMRQVWGVHSDTIPVHEVFEGKTVWKGDVEVFDLPGHKAQRVYAWAHLDGPQDDQTRFETVLEIPPVRDAKTAVQAAIMAKKPHN